ncbi:DUF881 domain-containing protein [Cellulomonas sp.]|uniref:DUF881 domain-containing protein n=1 Tax=Cellulomonas sp. TaxID=40001 RepID=UPI001B292EF8|nr:DUF881 domain-containing protein [Cellulomonas sp.]MBO9555866.1 DUF881 domain-containing protein [Cellulomonas sp.]
MTDHPHRKRRLVARGTLSVALVLALSGAIFAANAKFARATGDRHPEDLADLTEVEASRVEDLSSQVDALRSEVDTLTKDENSGHDVGSPGLGYVVEGGSTPVAGPGLSVKLDDAPEDSLRLPDVRPDLLVVHQQDIQSVMNALWAGGAEAMTLMDQRVISTSAVRCIGNVLILQGRRYSPPYTISAIGDPARLKQALQDSQAVQVYMRDARDLGLGWSVTVASDPLQLPAYSGATELSSASVPAGVEILPGIPATTTQDRSADESRPTSGSTSGPRSEP